MTDKEIGKLISSSDDPENRFELIDLIGLSLPVFITLSTLGFGSYGLVYKALDKQSGELFAIKIVNTISELDSLKREINIMKVCSSDYIVKYFGAYKKNN